MSFGARGLIDLEDRFLAGKKFTAVDAFFAPVAFRIQTYGIKMSQKALDYVAHMLSLGSMQTWYEQALEEPWREQGHEKEISATGTILVDYRSEL